MSSIFDYFTTGANESGEYPIIENEYGPVVKRGEEPSLERIQLRLGEKRFAILIRHPQGRHWCGYVCITDQIAWAVNQHLIRVAITPRVSYTDYGNEIICWMIPNAKGSLHKPVQIYPTPDARGDYWVGFSLRGQDVDAQTALAFLFSFEKTIRWFI